MKDVDGRVAFITGGASGIGFGMARAFLGAGMKVVIADVSAENLAQSRETLKGNNQVHFIQVDVTDRDAMARAADEAEAVFARFTSFATMPVSPLSSRWTQLPTKTGTTRCRSISAA